jgi:peptide/nickel transport system permease protein
MAGSTEPRSSELAAPLRGENRQMPARVAGNGFPLADADDLERRPSRLARVILLPWRALVAVYHDPRLLFGVVLLALAAAAILAPLIAPYDPLLYHPKDVAQTPSQTYLLGTDSLGRDVLSRVLYGARISLSVGLGSILIGGGIGTVFGLLAGYSGGWVDRLIGIIADALLAFPDLILALGIAAALGANIFNLVIALAVVRVPVYARLARAQTLQVRALQYVEAARAVGANTPRMLVRHILPNIFGPLLVQATISISFAILGESVLSFLGLGAPPPTPEWGSMIAEAQPFLTGRDPWMMLGPGLGLVITVLSLNLFGDALRDHLDPRSADRGVRPRTPRA